MSGPGQEVAVGLAREPTGAGRRPRPASRVDGCCGVRAEPSVVEVVVAPATLEVYERAGEGAVEALEQKLRALGLRLSVRRRSPCG